MPRVREPPFLYGMVIWLAYNLTRQSSHVQRMRKFPVALCSGCVRIVVVALVYPGRSTASSLHALVRVAVSNHKLACHLRTVLMYR